MTLGLNKTLASYIISDVLESLNSMRNGILEQNLGVQTSEYKKIINKYS